MKKKISSLWKLIPLPVLFGLNSLVVFASGGLGLPITPGSGGGGGGGSLVAPDFAYVPWDTKLFYDGILYLRNSLGVVINIGFWIFMAITGIYLVVKFVGSVGH